MLRGYLKVRDECAVCGEELHHHRADDGPAYLTILLVGHLMAPLFISLLQNGAPNLWSLPQSSLLDASRFRFTFCPD